MAWVRIDELYCEHPKLAKLGALVPLASWLQLSALAYCNRNLTDGRFPRELVVSWWPRLGYAIDGKNIEAHDVATAMVVAGIWEEDVAAGDYLVHDYLDYQPSKADVLKVRRARSRAGREGGSKRQANAKQNASKREAKVYPDPDPDPVVQEIPPTPLRGAEPADHLRPLKAVPMRPAQLRRKAEDLRARVWMRCQHDPPCDSYETCIAAIVDDLRAQPADALPEAAEA